MNPPRLFRALLSSALPEDVRDSTIADLQEMFAKRADRDGVFRARMWYRAQAVSFTARFAMHRVASSTAAPLLPSFSLLDWKLGYRMLFKYPVLSFVGTLALAVAIGVGSFFAQVGHIAFNPDLGFEEGDRIVRLDRIQTNEARSIPVESFLEWREKLTTVVELNAYRERERNLLGTDGHSLPILIAEVTPSALSVTRVEPEMGRAFVEGDVLAGAPHVVILGYEVWQRRFAGDPSILGREVQLGREAHRVVGVMPEGFAFPEYHEAWIPLSLADLRAVPGASVRAFGRVAPNETVERADAQLAALEGPTKDAAGRPLFRTLVIGFAVEPDQGQVTSLFALMLLMMLVAVSANVATLVFARTTMREAEIVVRSALGASRGRIIGQLFTEALVMSFVAAAAGLFGANAFLRYGIEYYVEHLGSRAPFWFDASLDPRIALETAGLAVLGAVLVAVLPAIKATGATGHDGLKSMTAGGTSMQFGGVWSVIIVLQVAITVLCLPIAVDFAQGAALRLNHESDFPAQSYLALGIAIDPDDAGAGEWRSEDERATRINTLYAEIERRLEAEPAVVAVTFGDLPGSSIGDFVQVEVDPLKQSEAPAIKARNGGEGVSLPSLLRRTFGAVTQVSVVDAGLFDVFGVPILAGRPLDASDVAAPSRSVVINETFARRLGVQMGASAVGSRMRVRSAGEKPGPWLEVVGIVRNVGADPAPIRPMFGNVEAYEEPFVYQAATPASATRSVLGIAVHTRGEPSASVPRVRQIVAQVDPGIRIRSVSPLADVIRNRTAEQRLGAALTVIAIALCVLLTATGLFALMAVAVTRRTREMGIRRALGASTVKVLSALFARAATQLVIGISIGSVAIITLTTGLPMLAMAANGRDLSTHPLMTAPGAFVVAQARGFAIPITVVSVTMLIVGLIACAVPARRALRIKPVEALREG
jgi:putative ABC transport system permease protein